MITKKENLITELCDEIDFLHEELEKAKKQETYYREQYTKLLDSDIKHGKQMMGMVLTAALKKAGI